MSDLNKALDHCLIVTGIGLVAASPTRTVSQRGKSASCRSSTPVGSCSLPSLRGDGYVSRPNKHCGHQVGTTGTPEAFR
jgi:hypothetical protein